MSGMVRRVATLAAMLPLVAIVVLGATPNARAGIVVQSATVTIVKVTDPAVDVQDFAYAINGSPFDSILDTDPTSLDVLNTRTFQLESDDLGYFIVTEEVLSDWMLTDILCTGDSDADINVAAENVVLQVENGDAIVCTFYNTKRAQLTLRKVTQPGNDPQDFSFGLTGAAVAGVIDLDTDPNSAFTSSSTSSSLGPDDLGAYTIIEQATTGWALMDITCTGAGNDSSVNLATRTATLDIDAGELVECVFTNGKLPLLTLTKVTDPASDPQDFYIDVKSIFNTTLDTDPTSLDTPDTEWTSLANNELGPRTVEETVPEGWTLTDISCPGDADAQVDLENNWVVLDVDEGENIHCTFTNTKDSDEPTIEPTGDQGGATDAATEPGTSTEGPSAEAGSMLGTGIAIVVLLLLSGSLLLTRPKRTQ